MRRRHDCSFLWLMLFTDGQRVVSSLFTLQHKILCVECSVLSGFMDEDAICNQQHCHTCHAQGKKICLAGTAKEGAGRRIGVVAAKQLFFSVLTASKALKKPNHNPIKVISRSS
jgi:hypothetical protein